MESVINPQIPYVGRIQPHFSSGKWIKICGTPPLGALRFAVSLRCETNEDMALHMSVNIIDNNISINSMRQGLCEEAQTILRCPIKNQARFEIILTCDQFLYRIFINGEPFCDFPQRIAPNRLQRVVIDGDVNVEMIAQGTDTLPFAFKQPPPPDAPPPSYNDVQSKFHGSPPSATHYGTCSFPNYAPFPPFGTVMPNYPQYLPPPTVYPAPIPNTVSLNAASSNFRPVAPSNRKRQVQCAIIVFFIVLFIVTGVVADTKKERNDRLYDRNY